MKKFFPVTLVFLAFLIVYSFNSYGQVFTCSYQMVAVNNSSHGCNDGGINTTLPANIYPSLAHDVYYNGAFITTISLGPLAGTTFFSTVFFDGHGLGTWEYYAHYLDSLGNRIDCNYHKVIVTEPPCDLTIAGFTSTRGMVCSAGQVSGTVSGNFCSQWTNTVARDSINGAIVYSNTGSVTPSSFTIDSLPSGIYYAHINDATCTNEYNTTVNSCTKPNSGFAVSGITSTQAKVEWSVVSCALNYQVRYRPAGSTDPWMKKSTSGNVGSRLLKGLLASTTYGWQVRSKCYAVPTIWSAWSSKHTFTTTAVRIIAENETDGMSAQDLKLNLFPSPTHDQLTILFESNDDAVHLQIINMSGQLIWSTDVISTGGFYSRQVDVSQLPSGFYLVQLKTNGGFESRRFVKE